VETAVAEGGQNPVARLCGRTLGESWPPEPTSSYTSIDFWCQLVASPATAVSWMLLLTLVNMLCHCRYLRMVSCGSSHIIACDTANILMLNWWDSNFVVNGSKLKGLKEDICMWSIVFLTCFVMVNHTHFSTALTPFCIYIFCFPGVLMFCCTVVQRNFILFTLPVLQFLVVDCNIWHVVNLQHSKAT